MENETVRLPVAKFNGKILGNHQKRDVRNTSNSKWENAKRCGCDACGRVFRGTPSKVNGKMQNGADAMRVVAFFAERL